MSVKNISVREARDKQAEGYVYVDVRSIPEFAREHPAGAVNVPLLHADETTGRMMPNREFLQVVQANFPADAKLLIGCQVGGRSAQAAQLLAASGYLNVCNVLGGFGGARDPMTGSVHAEGWEQAGLPTESGNAPGSSYEDLRSGNREGG